MPLGRTVICLIPVLTALAGGLAQSGRAAPETPPPQATEQAALLVRFPAKALLLDATQVGSRLVAVGVQGVIITSEDAGATWSQAPAPVSGMLTCVSFADAQHGWAAGHNGVLLTTVDGGRSWTRVAAPTTTDDSFLDVLALPDGHVLAGGAYGLFLISRDGGATWEKRPALDEDVHINRVSVGSTGTLYLAAEAGTLAVSSDHGASWERFESPYEGSFYGLHELASGRLLAHGLRGHVFFSDDRGATWKQSTIDFDGLLADAVEMSSGTVVVAGSGGKLFLSRDDGASFTTGPTTGLNAAAELVAVDGVVISVGDSGANVTRLTHP